MHALSAIGVDVCPRDIAGVDHVGDEVDGAVEHDDVGAAAVGAARRDHRGAFTVGAEVVAVRIGGRATGRIGGQDRLEVRVRVGRVAPSASFLRVDVGRRVGKLSVRAAQRETLSRRRRLSPGQPPDSRVDIGVGVARDGIRDADLAKRNRIARSVFTDRQMGFADEFAVDEKTAVRFLSSFGGRIGVAPREVAGVARVTATSEVVRLIPSERSGAHRVAVGRTEERADRRRVRVGRLPRGNRGGGDRIGGVILVVSRRGLLETGGDRVKNSGLLKVRKEQRLRGNLIEPSSNVGAPVRIAAQAGAVGIPILIRDAPLRVGEVLERESKLFKVVGALHASRRLQSRLNGGQEQPDKNPDNSDDDKKFDEGKTSR